MKAGAVWGIAAIISLAEYFGPWMKHPDATLDRMEAAQTLLDKVNDLLLYAEAHGVPMEINPKTETEVSGEQYGGFRPQCCTIGAAHSAHKEARAVDIYDPNNDLDRWLTDGRLEEYGLYREAPSSTEGWTHLSDRAPPSGRRTFAP